MTTEEYGRVTGVDDDKQSVLLKQVIFNGHAMLWHHRASNPKNRGRLCPLRLNVLFYYQPFLLPYKSHLCWSPGACQCDQAEYSSFLAVTSGHKGLVWCRWGVSISTLWTAHNIAIPMPKHGWFPLSAHPQLLGQTTVIWSSTSFLKAMTT